MKMLKIKKRKRQNCTSIKSGKGKELSVCAQAATP